MSRLFMLLLTISVGSLAGVGVIIALTLGYYSWPPMLAAAAIGAVGALPISWLVARRIQTVDPQQSVD